jgi:hypothetical protein
VCGFVSPALASRTLFIAFSSWVGGIFKKKEQDDALSTWPSFRSTNFFGWGFLDQKTNFNLFSPKNIYKKLL